MLKIKLNSFHWKFTSNSFRIHFEFTLNSVLQNHFIGNKASGISKKFPLIFLLKLCLLFCLICLLKILNRKSTVLKAAIGFDVWMAAILNYMLFFISNNFSNTRLKLLKNQAKSKQNSEAGLLLFGNYSFSSSMLLSKTTLSYSKKCAKNKCFCFNEIIWMIIIKLRVKMK